MKIGRNPLVFIFVTRMIDAIGFGIVMPVLPQLLMSMGAPNVSSAASTAGWLIATYAILQFICGPLIGNLSDRFGRRPVILASLFAYGFDYTLTGFAPTITWLFLGRAVAGVAGAVYVPANAFVADVTPPEQRARAFGLVASAFGLGFIIGPGIGGLLGVLGPRAPFFAAGALAVVNFLFGIFVLPESLPVDRRRTFSWRRANPLGAALALQKYPSVLVYALVVMIFFIGNNVYPSTWAFFTAERFGWGSAMTGWSLVATGAAMALVQVKLVGSAVKRFGETRTAIAGLGIAATGALAYAFIPDAWMIFAFTVIFAPQAITYPALNALMSKQVPPNAQGELQGAAASVMSVANIAGPYVMTQVFAYFTAPGAPVHFSGAAFIVASALSLFGLIVLATQLARATVTAPI